MFTVPQHPIVPVRSEIPHVDWNPEDMGIGRSCGTLDLPLLPAPQEHLEAGYHRKRVGLNRLAIKGESRAQIDALQS